MHLTHFYLWLYGRHMVKDHSDSERGNPLPPHGLLFPINSKDYFICTIPDRIAHTTAFVTPVMKHWLEIEIAQWVHPMKDRSDNPSHHERTLLPRSYISLPTINEPLTHLCLIQAADLRSIPINEPLTHLCLIQAADLRSIPINEPLTHLCLIQAADLRSIPINEPLTHLYLMPSS